MKNSIHEPNRNSEAYSPKKPAIVTMAKNAGKQITAPKYDVKFENGGSYIDGIPMLKWGEWKDSSYAGCVTALLNAIGIPVSYEEVMGLSGVCYQMIMCDNWDPSSQMPQNGLQCENNVGAALGISVYTLSDENEIREQAKKSIDNGVPLLLVGGRSEPEWTLACGYAIERSQCKFFGRTYFDLEPKNVPENEIYTANQYYYFNGFPGWFPEGLTRFYDRKCQPIPQKTALKVSLETCVKMFEQSSSQNHKYGYDAYDLLIRGFRLTEKEYKEKCGCGPYHIGCLMDARRAAYIYLSESAQILDGENKTLLSKAANLYRSMLINLTEVIPYEKTSIYIYHDLFPSWDNATRDKLSDVLTENVALEKQVRTIVKEILENWED